jgi:hypothetical protein
MCGTRPSLASSRHGASTARRVGASGNTTFVTLVARVRSGKIAVLARLELPMRRALPFALALAFSLDAAHAADGLTTIPAEAIASAAKLRDAALKDDTAWKVLESLTTEVGPRLAGSANDSRAVAWAKEKFKALGYDRVWTEPVTYPRWVRRGESAELVAPFPQKLAVLALGFSPGTAKGGLTAEVVAFDSLDALKAADAATIKGKLVYVGARMQQHKDGADYGIGGTIRRKGPALAASKGAAGFVLRSAGTDTDRLPHTGATQWEEKGPQIPAAALSNVDADMLERTLKRGQAVRLKLALDCGVEGSYTGANVIGEIRGSSKPDEVIVMGGHLDSWDPGTGAIDDGAGVAIGMAAGHLIAALKPARSVRVIAYANEEMGLFGGKAYAAAHKDEVARHVLGSESDFGAGRIWRLSASVKPEARGAVDQMMQVLSPLGVERGTGTGDAGPDLGQMHKLGMAGLSLTQDGTHYFDWHHTASDTLDKVVPADLAQNVAVYVSWAYLAAQAEGDFGSAAGAFAGEAEE